LYAVEDTGRGINLRLSRTHPKFIEKLFAMEAPEIESGVVEIKSTAREAGARSKIAVYSNDEHIDAVGSCVGQKGTRVNTITTELGGEKIDIIPWSTDPKVFVSNAISPAKVLSIEIDEADPRFKCPICGSGMVVKLGKGGKFLSCERFPDCTGMRNIDGSEVKEAEALGTDPTSNLPVFVMDGRFGPYVQLGEKNDDNKKPRRASIPKDIEPNSITLEQALKLLSLPRALGPHPETGEIISANIGRYPSARLPASESAPEADRTHIDRDR
jgi:transcription antitermination factor NusA-like protein